MCPGFSGVEISGFWLSDIRRSRWEDGAIPPSSDARVLDLLAEGRSVASVAHDLDVSDQTIYRWRKQDRIDHVAT